jgi:VWFA-related protein
VSPIRLRRIGLSIVAAAAAWLSTSTAHVQEPSEQPATPAGQEAPSQPVFRTGVNLVRVDVTATGRGDKPVDDLKAGDFEITEDDVPQVIEAFQFVRLTGEQDPGSDTSLNIRSRDHGAAEVARDDVRVFAIFLDEYHISEDLATNLRLRNSLSQWIEEALRPTDIIVMMDPLTPISAVEYTRDKDKVLEIIRKFKGRRGVYVPPRSILEEGQATARNPARIRAQVTLSALNAIVTHLGSIRERRTSVIFVSEGPPMWFSDATLEEDYQEVVAAANRFNVTINVADPRGLGNGSPADIMWRLSADTGGRAVVNTNGVSDGLMRIAQDASAYYLLGYAPTRQIENDGKFHKIEVKSKRRGVKVVSRKGYWAPSEKELSSAPAIVVPAGVTRALDALSELEGGRRAITWMGFEPGSTAGRTRVLVSWQPLGLQQRAAASAPTTLSVGGREESESSLAVQRIVLDKSDASRTDNIGSGSFEVKPGSLKLAFLLETVEGELVDRWKEDVTVPAFRASTPALASPRVLLARSVPEYRALTAAPDTAVPTPKREFRRTDRVLVRTTVNSASELATPVVASLLNRTGAHLVKLQIAKDSTGIVQMELPVASLAIGDYILKLEIPDHADSASQHVAFRIVP